MKKFLLILLLFSLNITNVYSLEADVFIQSTVNRAAETLNGSLTKEQRVEKLKEIAKETVDIKGIGFYSLGSHRKDLSKDQLTSYTNIFEEYFLKSFSSRLAEYSNPEIEVNSKKSSMKITLLFQALLLLQKAVLK